MEQAAEESRHEIRDHEHPHAQTDPPPERATFGELTRRVVAGIFFIPLAGPPVLLLLGPWLLLVLLIIPPAAALITLVLVLVVAGGILAAVATLIASPYLLAHYLVTREPIHRHWFAFLHRSARRATQYIPVPQAKGTA
jgi:uncharacterized membrane protein